VLEDRDCLTEQRQPFVSADRQGGGTQRHAQRAGRADPPGRRQLLARKLRSLLLVSQCGQRRSRVRPPSAWPQRRPVREPPTAPQEVRDTLLELTLGYPQPPARDYELGDVGAFLGDSYGFAGSCQTGRGIQRSALDVHGQRHRDEQLRDEMLVLYEQQPGLRLDLRVVQRTLRECAPSPRPSQGQPGHAAHRRPA
jgi:hypothetical protein